MAEIVLTKLSKVSPRGTVALDHVDLRVADGEFMVLVGPSGCGNSTSAAGDRRSRRSHRRYRGHRRPGMAMRGELIRLHQQTVLAGGHDG